ncbi:Uncharacterized protein PHSC3_001113 [Chlamydiales bacterium STE3]|nr:Uncharacterized protein PHSC3_001113 [Chlamydiales bacterium STE3]
MIEYKLLNLNEHRLEELEAYFPLLDPKARRLFCEKPEDNELFLAAIAYKESEPVGLSFGQAFPLLEQGFIYSLFVQEGHREKGIGTALLAHLSDEFLKSTNFLQIRYNSYDPFCEVLQKILTKLKWQAPQVITERYHFYAPTFAPEWYTSKEPILPKNVKISPWQHLSNNHLASIRKIIKSNPILEDISPFNDPLPMENKNCLVLKRNNKILAWIITHRYDQDTIRYSALYIDRDLRGAGPVVALLKESIKRQKASPIKKAFTEINIKRTPAYWKQFVKKRLAPYATHLDYSLISFYVK